MATLDALIEEAGLRKTDIAKATDLNAATITRIARGAPTTRTTVNRIVRFIEKHLERKIDVDSIEGLNITK